MPGERKKIEPPLRHIPYSSCVISDGEVLMTTTTTLLDLVSAVSAHASSDAEVVATIVHLVNSGAVRLCGTFRGARFDLGDVGLDAVRAA